MRPGQDTQQTYPPKSSAIGRARFDAARPGSALDENDFQEIDPSYMLPSNPARDARLPESCYASFELIVPLSSPACRHYEQMSVQQGARRWVYFAPSQLALPTLDAEPGMAEPTEVDLVPAFLGHPDQVSEKCVVVERVEEPTQPLHRRADR